MLRLVGLRPGDPTYGVKAPPKGAVIANKVPDRAAQPGGVDFSNIGPVVPDRPAGHRHTALTFRLPVTHRHGRGTPHPEARAASPAIPTRLCY